MVAFDFLDKLFDQIKAFNEYSQALLSISTAIGLSILAWLTFKLLYHTIQGLRLYFFSQLCCKTNYANKYGKWAIVTGATDGIGLEMAKELAKRGQSIIIVGRNDEKLARSKEEIANAAGDNDIEVLTVKIDMSNSSQENYKHARELIDPDNRDIGLLINNAGCLPGQIKIFHEFEDADFLTTVNVNVVGLLYFTRMIIPGMVKRGRGCVLNVSSTAGFQPTPYMNVYGATKSFVTLFTRQLMFEYRNFPIDIINITPGAVQTKLYHSVYNNQTLKKANIFTPAPKDYATTVINAISTRISEFAGCLGHGLSLPAVKVFNCLCVSNYLMLLSYRFNPDYKAPVYVPQSKNLAGDVPLETTAN